MAVVAVAPFVLKNVTLKIAADNYEAHVSQVEFTPSASQVTWKSLTPSSVVTDVTTATWTCTIAYAQDWKTANSLAQYLHANEGTAVVAEFVPVVGAVGSPKFTATLVITPGAIGGTVDAIATATVTLAVQGKPVKGVTS